MKISPARIAAFDVLLRIEREDAYSSALLAKYESDLNEKDRGLCHELVLGVLRNKLYLDRIIKALSNERKLDAEVRITLEIGLFQMIFLDRVPAHSAVNESVELSSRAKKSSAKGFVNAILRSFRRGPPAISYADSNDRFAAEASHPRWLIDRWSSQFGEETAQAICRKNNETPAVAFRAVRGIGDALAGFEAKKQIRRSTVVPNCFIAIRYLDEFREMADRGEIYFQDEGSQLVGNAVVEFGGDRILDVCAAPGGKTSLMAKSMDATIIAGDVHSGRVERLRATCKSQGAKVSVIRLDAESRLPFELQSFDTVFVDAPCSGTGTIRHNPEIRYRIRNEDIVQLSTKQLQMLENASDLVRPGGLLFYSTCSLETDENEEVARKFLRAHAEFSVETPRVAERFLTAEGFARTFPHLDQMDGFFAAAFRRN